MKRMWIRRAMLALGRLAMVLDFPQSDERMMAYCQGLASLKIEALEWACLEAEKNFRFFPKIVELRELAATVPLSVIPVATPPMLQALPGGRPDPEEARERLRGMMETLNGKFGTEFRVSEKGSPVVETKKRRVS